MNCAYLGLSLQNSDRPKMMDVLVLPAVFNVPQPRFAPENKHAVEEDSSVVEAPPAVKKNIKRGKKSRKWHGTKNAHPVSENLSKVLGRFWSLRILSHRSTCLTVMLSFWLSSNVSASLNLFIGEAA